MIRNIIVAFFHYLKKKKKTLFILTSTYYTHCQLSVHDNTLDLTVICQSQQERGFSHNKSTKKDRKQTVVNTTLGIISHSKVVVEHALYLKLKVCTWFFQHTHSKYRDYWERCKYRMSIGFDARIILILQVRIEVRSWKLHRETAVKNDVQQARRVRACGSQRHGQQ